MNLFETIHQQLCMSPALHQLAMNVSLFLELDYMTDPHLADYTSTKILQLKLYAFCIEIMQMRLSTELRFSGHLYWKKVKKAVNT